MTVVLGFPLNVTWRVLSDICLIDIIALLANGLSRTPTPVDAPVLFLQAEAVTSWNPSGKFSY